MAEKIKIVQNSNMETYFWANDQNEPDTDVLYEIDDLHELSPYGMMLAGLGACTGIVLHIYARHHGMDLQQVRLLLEYQRNFKDDSEKSEENMDFQERISEKMELNGKLSSEDKQKLLQVSKICPVEKILERGIRIELALNNI
jgi:uncharacterized OsmC-like protein